MSIDLSSYLNVFADEAREHLQNLNGALLTLETDTGNLSLINDIFRSAHTLKGMSATMGFNNVAELTHNIENFLDQVRSGKQKIKADHVDLLFKCLDALQEMIETVISGQTSDFNVDDLVGSLVAAVKGEPLKTAAGSASASAPVKPVTKQKSTPNAPLFPVLLNETEKSLIDSARLSGKNCYHIQAHVSPECTMKSARAFVVYNIVDEIGELIKTSPDVQDIENDRFDTQFDYLFITETSLEDFRTRLESISELESITIVNYHLTDEISPTTFDNPFPRDLTNSEIESIKLDSAQNILHCLRVTLNHESLLKSVRVFMVKQELTNFGKIYAQDPPQDVIDTEKFDVIVSFIVGFEVTPAEIVKSITGISEIDNAEVLPFSLYGTIIADQPQTTTGAKTKMETDYVATAVIDPEVVEQSAATTEQGIVQQSSAAIAAESSRKDIPEAKKDAPTAQAKSHQTIRVDTEKLDTLLNLVGELVTNKTRLQVIGSQFKSSDLNDTIEQIGRTTTDLQNVVMKTRMVPIETVFNRFPRMIRDLAKARNKEVELIMEGKETELDRTVVDEIGDPLVHLIRNAIDHGVETAASRQAAGKPPIGSLRLAAFNEGNSVFIEVEDDGHGINPQTIARKAIERGILEPSRLNDLTLNEAVKILFQPGFSTADVVSDISGRGVGMDVVKTKIESLSGSVSAQSELGKGSKFIIKLPLTLAIVQALMVRVGDEDYAIPLAYIEETRFNDEIKVINNEEVILLRGNILPLMHLSEILSIPNSNTDQPKYIVVVRSGHRRVGLTVDTTIGQLEIVIKSLGNHLANLDYLSGATILGDGRVALILDVAKILH